MFNHLFVILLIILSASIKTTAAACNGNGACEPKLGETWSNCAHDCCKTADCDCIKNGGTNDCNHKPAPEHPGVGHVHNRKHKVYRYHGADENL